jgi:AraC family transcriptional regulator of adaptative response/methylated-DNA-[protein]-cysteine methyltransferase
MTAINPSFDDFLHDEDALWQALVARDSVAFGSAIYGVTSTRIYCRLGCPSRRPRRDRVRFFQRPEDARAEGFRACQRCEPDSSDVPEDAVRRAVGLIEAACGEDGVGRVPSLAELGRAVGLSPSHLQKRFREALGVTPRGYADRMRRQLLKDGLRAGEGVAGATYGAGYGSSSRVYEGGGTRLGMTPATYARGGRGAEISFAIADSDLGRLLVAATERGVCAVYLGDDDARLEDELRNEFPAASIERDREGLEADIAMVLESLETGTAPASLPLDVRASAFQAQVWEALRAIPVGETRTYGQIAETLGIPRGARAVGRACATNPVSLVIPCHRAVRNDSGLGGYRWGLERKRALLEKERG